MSLVFPGQPLSSAVEKSDGVYVDSNGVPRASLIGIFKNNVRKSLGIDAAVLLRSLQNLHVPKLRANAPIENSIVLGTVLRLSSQQATLAIQVVDNVPLPYGEDYTGVIRSQDVRATEKDKIKIADCFRGGDIVAGQVISLGDSRSYYISTARNDLGVLYATSASGAPMEPYSWEAMYCPRDGTIEPRKVAQPSADYSKHQHASSKP
ncbi:exosome 3'-_5 exonuclease subunit ski4 (Csl4) [Serendipita sp. 400]|nr:exosome 3'->5 exonuclease subunit ski4 (Csl4) [Serendipita sp. 400]